MKPKVIKTEPEYEAALARIEKLLDAKPNTAHGDESELLSLLVHDYEEKAFPIDKPDPITAIRFRMEQQVRGNFGPDQACSLATTAGQL